MGATLRLALARLALVGGLLLIWEVSVRAGWVSPRMLPPPGEVWTTLLALLRQDRTVRDIGVTLLQTLTASAVVAPVGLVIGIGLAESLRLGRIFNPLIYFLFSVPKSIFLPIFILAFGIGFAQKVMFGVFSAIFVVVMTTRAAVEAVPRDLVDTARAFGATDTQIYARVYVPAMLPSVVEGLRLAMMFNITGIILAEMYASREGLGHMVAFWGENFMLRELLAGILIAAALSIVVNEALRWYEGRLGRWRV